MTQDRLTYARRRAKRFLPDPCTILRKTATYDDQGNPAEAYVDKYPDEQQYCRVTTPNLFSGVQLDATAMRGALLNVVLWHIEVSFDVDIDPNDHIEAKGHTFVVRGVRGPKTSEVTRHVDVATVGEGELSG
jgi:hypothetical protein